MNKKILSGTLGIIGTLAAVSGIAFATTFGHVTANGMEVTTQNDLLISDTSSGTFSQDLNLTGVTFPDLDSQSIKTKKFYFKNQTGKTTTALTAMKVGSTNNPAFDQYILVGFKDGTSTDPAGVAFSSLTAWAGGAAIPSVAISGSSHGITMFVKLDPATPRAEVGNYDLTGINFDFGPVY